MDAGLTTALLGVAGALAGIVWKLLNEKIKSHKDDCDKEIAKLWDQIGRSSEEGMRYKVHNSAPHSSFTELEERVRLIETNSSRKR